MADAIGRVVALGASNLTRGFRAVVSTARDTWGPQVEVMAALGHGRSYGAHSRLAFRRLPGILESGLWSELESRPRLPTRALVTDVGNDILYGFTAEQTLAWIEETVQRLTRVTHDIILTDLPLAGIRRLSNLKFLAFRSILVPSCRLSLTQVVDTAERVNQGLIRLSAASGAKLLELDPAWYGFDPIHVRPSSWREAWQQILGVEPGNTPSGSDSLEAMRLYFLRPERRWLFGVEQFTRQSGVALRSGGRVWLY
jgi:hypothetical protein